jgi:DNA-binding NarL/FixJ family response regulator
MSSSAQWSRGGPDERQLHPEGVSEDQRLTTREKQVLEYFAGGFGTETVAAMLAISPVTVRNHAQRILAKLGVHSRLAAVARGYRDGLIVLGPPLLDSGPPRE